MSTSPTCPRSPLVIAIDGPAGAGKSTVARMLAARLGLPYLDTGAMYRAVGLLASRAGLLPPYDAESTERVAELAATHAIELVAEGGATRVLVDGEDVSDAIRSPECSRMASAVSALPRLRRLLVAMQRELGAAAGGVMEGRDIGTVVFPDAALKVFLTAGAEERARRRQRDLELAGRHVPLEDVLSEQQERDRRDSTREDSPLQVAEDALVLDTTALGIEVVVERLLAALGSRLDSSRGKP